jgi:hypothetical protein
MHFTYLHYKKRWNFYGHAYAMVIINSGDRKFVTSSMNAIPTNKVYMSMSPAEFALLPNESHAVHSRMKVHMFNCTTTFRSNASKVLTVTQNDPLFCNYSHGLKSKHPGTAALYSSDASAPMVPTEMRDLSVDDELNLIQALYGDANINQHANHCATENG